MVEKFDAIVIGAGQAGPALAVRCGREGLKTAIVERKLFGGTCVNNGCIPTKTLVASARAAAIARRAADYGVVLSSPVEVDMARVKARKDRIVEQSRDGVAAWLRAARNVTVIEGHARFRGPRETAVGDRSLAAERIFVNVGARARVPELRGIEAVPYLTNSTVMDLKALPEHLIVIGGSYIGLEFAQIYRRFGARVTICEMAPRIVAREGEDVSDALTDILQGEGIEIRTGAQCMTVTRRGSGIAVGLECSAGAPVIEGSHLLLAVGRTPNTHDLGLDAAGVSRDRAGFIEVNERLETSAPGVWAVGEVNARGAFTQTSWNDYEIVAANLVDGASRRVTDRIPTYALFTDPPLGRAGMTEREARATGRALLAAKLPMSRVGRAREAGETAGFMKVVVDAESGRILGASLLGLACDEVVQTLLPYLYSGEPYTRLQRAVHIHPTVSELVPTLLEGLEPLV
jgi:pyruvate/2-oxoglutarate dehydrogenase complex dihydrolipoamide dehydrogenase (E3) component